MQRFVVIILAIFIMSMPLPVRSADKDLTNFASDMVGVKLQHPSNWISSEFKWGFMLVEPISTSTITVQVYFMPKELEKAYDINMNPIFAKIYGSSYESLEEGEKDIAGVKWDYTLAHGAKGTPMEYYEKSYTCIIENTVYAVQTFEMAKTPDETRKAFDAVIDSIRLMYKDGDLPMIRDYGKAWNNAKKSNKPLNYSNDAGDTTITYSTPWMYAGAGASAETAFHYLSGDPMKDIDMIILRMPGGDAKKSASIIQDTLSMLTSGFSSTFEGNAVISNKTFYLKELTQGTAPDIMYTRLYSCEYSGGTVMMIFAYHELAKANADAEIKSFLDKVVLK